MYPVKRKQPRHANNFQTSLDLYLVHLRLWEYLEIFPEECVPPPGITGTQQHHHLLDKPAFPCLTQHRVVTSSWLCAHSPAADLQSCPEVLLLSKRRAARHRDTADMLTLHTKLATPTERALQSKHMGCYETQLLHHREHTQVHFSHFICIYIHYILILQVVKAVILKQFSTSVL